MLSRNHQSLADGGLVTSKVLVRACFAENAPGAWGILALGPESGEIVVVKLYASAFFGTSLATTLHAAGADTLMIAGVSMSGCVRATAMDALKSGFHPHVVRQACADRTPRWTTTTSPTSTPSTPTSSTWRSAHAPLTISGPRGACRRAQRSRPAS